MFFAVYDYIAIAAIVGQLVFIFNGLRNYRYALRHAAKDRPSQGARTLLTVPCKGLEETFDRNIRSFFGLDYTPYHLRFVVESQDDPAYPRLCEIIREQAPSSRAVDVEVLVAGHAQGCSQKIHNLLYSWRHRPESVEVLAFADSDACIGPEWLSHLVHPLRKGAKGAVTGYRWFVPQKNNSATLALSALNAKVAQLLGNNRFNQAWGGSMAIRTETFEDVGLDKIWQTALSDDLCLSYAVKNAGMRIGFAPRCMVASYEQITWPRLFEFARRQFMITRFTTPGTWWFGLLSSFLAVLGLWGGLAMALWALSAGITGSQAAVYFAVPILFFIGQELRAVLRQKMIARLLPGHVPNLKKAARADIFGTVLWTWLMFICILASAFGRKIKWRGITYKLLGPDKTVIQSNSSR